MSSQTTLWVAKDLKRLQVDSKDSDRPVRMCRLIGVFAGLTGSLVGNSVPGSLTQLIMWSYTFKSFVLSVFETNKNELR